MTAGLTLGMTLEQAGVVQEPRQDAHYWAWVRERFAADVLRIGGIVRNDWARVQREFIS